MTARQIRQCPFCDTATGHLAADEPHQRLYECHTCFSVNVITKGEKSWWYHGWEHPDGRRVNSEGKCAIRPRHVKFGWWDAQVSRV